MARKKKNRKVAKRLIIVCGTEKTEPIYFKGYKKHLRDQRIHIEGLEVFPSKTKNQAPDKLLKYASGLINEYDLDFESGDTIWCVFDYDDFDEKIKNSINLKKYKNIEKIISTRCFELWYYLHFNYSAKFIKSTTELEKLLTEILKQEYNKNKDYFSILLDKQNIAIKNAKKLEKYHTDAGNKLQTKDANPSTNVFKLVQFLNDFKD